MQYSETAVPIPQLTGGIPIRQRAERRSLQRYQGIIQIVQNCFEAALKGQEVGFGRFFIRLFSLLFPNQHQDFVHDVNQAKGDTQGGTAVAQQRPHRQPKQYKFRQQ